MRATDWTLHSHYANCSGAAIAIINLPPSPPPCLRVTSRDANGGRGRGKGDGKGREEDRRAFDRCPAYFDINNFRSAALTGFYSKELIEPYVYSRRAIIIASGDGRA